MGFTAFLRGAQIMVSFPFLLTSFQDEFEDELANALAVCVNFCLVDELLLPCIAREK